MSGDIGIYIALIGVLAGISILAGAFAGAYFFGKSRGQGSTLRAGSDPELLARIAALNRSWNPPRSRSSGLPKANDSPPNCCRNQRPSKSSSDSRRIVVKRCKR